ncbi:DNA-binding protein [Oleiharenicola lentus]|uniref:DNA-(apurinic or apyrimidinic site) lyase n=1 Tax=Oleiharenicola lentus TaxID=2508720 RepID=A0A4Q1C4V9_9BACT|nr:DNA glycosylase [Oleiharenicola lentus]RXK53333.1 DNA-binding protein [Oleiharenicola lentus]
MTRSGSSKGFSDWQPLPGWAPSPDVLRETLDGGQAFRWNEANNIWTGTWSTHCVQLRLGDTGLQWRGTPGTTAADLRRYLAHELDWTALTNSLPWRSDTHLAHCITAFPDLRILRQPFGETLLGFLCSATKQIVQIKQMVALLAERHGQSLPPWRAQLPLGRGSAGAEPSTCHRLPTWSEIATIPEKDLRACLLGFRARYISETATFLSKHPGWLDETEALPYPAAKARLMELPGVGEKVADCVLLFGAGKLEAFPVDTWVLKSLARRYGLDGWKPAQVAHFGRTHFGPLAGLAQQYLFSWERKFGGR